MGWRDFFKSGRRGIINFEAEGAGLFNKGVRYAGVIELEELEQVQDMSRVRIVKVSGVPDMAGELVPDWIRTDEIKWLEHS